MLPLRLVQHYEAIVGIEICRQVYDCQTKSSHARLCWYHHRQLLADDGFHDHVKIVVDRGSPCMTHWCPLNGSLMHPLALSTMVSCPSTSEEVEASWD